MNRLTLLVCLLLVLTAGPAGQTVTAESPPEEHLSAAPYAQKDTATPTKSYSITLQNHTEDTATFEVNVTLEGLAGSTQYVALLRDHSHVRINDVAGVTPTKSESGTRYWTVTEEKNTSASFVVTTNRTRLVAGAPRIPITIIDVVALTRSGDRVETTREVRIDGSGRTVGRWAYFGEAEVTSITVDGQRVPVVKPSGIQPRTDPAAIEREINRTVRGQNLPAPPATFSIWYREKIRVEMSYNTDPVGIGGYDTIDLETTASGEAVRHEYVHIAQRPTYDNRTTWFLEGSADYVAHLAGVQHNQMRVEGLYNEINVTETNATHNLTNQEGVYSTGEQVVAALDLRLRSTTNGTVTVVDVILYLNQEAGNTVTLPEVYTAVERVGGKAHATWLRSVIVDRRVPPVPEPNATKSHLVQSWPNVDLDGDKLPNAAEERHGTDPFTQDTDDDGLTDKHEIEQRLDPTTSDTDGDGLNDDVDRKPRTSTINAKIKFAGLVVASVSGLSVWITIGVGVLRMVDGIIGIVPRRIASLSVRRLLAVNIGGMLLGGLIYWIGMELPGIPV